MSVKELHNTWNLQVIEIEIKEKLEFELKPLILNYFFNMFVLFWSTMIWFGLAWLGLVKGIWLSLVWFGWVWFGLVNPQTKNKDIY